MWWAPDRGLTGPKKGTRSARKFRGHTLGPASRNHHHWKLLTPNRKRRAVEVLRDRFGVSERRACTVVGIHRSTMRLTPLPVTAEEAELRVWLRRFSTDRPRWGWRRAAKMARRAGWKVNNKRIRRLWREEGLRVPQRRRRKRLTGIGVAVGAMSPIRPNVIWAMDFQFDTTADGRTVKMLNVIDECRTLRAALRRVPRARKSAIMILGNAGSCAKLLKPGVTTISSSQRPPPEAIANNCFDRV